MLTLIGLIAAISPIAIAVFNFLAVKTANEKSRGAFEMAKQSASYVEEMKAANPDLFEKPEDALQAAIKRFQEQNAQMPVAEIEKLIVTALPLIGAGASAKK